MLGVRGRRWSALGHQAEPEAGSAVTGARSGLERALEPAGIVLVAGVLVPAAVGGQGAGRLRAGAPVRTVVSAGVGGGPADGTSGLSGCRAEWFPGCLTAPACCGRFVTNRLRIIRVGSR